MSTNSGILYLCATPIGNLEDMTFRAVRVLREVDLIAAEDTRNSIKLLNHFDIHTPMTSYHEYNKTEKGRSLIKRLLGGQSVALITDAGTPGISDPGEDLVRMCQEEGIAVTCVPGASACVTALVLSGLPAGRFCFEAFLPAEKKERRQILEELYAETRTAVVYEAPHRLKKTLAELYETLGDRRLTVCRELTKKHETVFKTTLKEAVDHYEIHEPRGECVLVIEGRSRESIDKERQQAYLEMPVEEHVRMYEELGLSRKDAMKQAAKDRGIGKREIYQALLDTENQ